MFHFLNPAMVRAFLVSSLLVFFFGKVGAILAILLLFAGLFIASKSHGAL